MFLPANAGPVGLEIPHLNVRAPELYPDQGVFWSSRNRDTFGWQMIYFWLVMKNCVASPRVQPSLAIRFSPSMICSGDIELEFVCLTRLLCRAL